MVISEYNQAVADFLQDRIGGGDWYFTMQSFNKANPVETHNYISNYSNPNYMCDYYKYPATISELFILTFDLQYLKLSDDEEQDIMDSIMPEYYILDDITLNLVKDDPVPTDDDIIT